MNKMEKIGINPGEMEPGEPNLTMYPYISPTPGEMPLIGWRLCYDYDKPTAKDMKNVQEWGLKDGDVQYLVIVSHSVTTSQYVKVTFDRDKYNMKSLTHPSGPVTDIEGATRIDKDLPLVTEFTLEPGGIAIYQVYKK